MTQCRAFVIGAANSGSGKTSITIALAAALRKRGLQVQTFKVGPDFLDPTWLASASGRTCYNLDPWMTSPAYVKSLFAEATRDADIALVEGVMGLFDGASPSDLEGSSADVAKLLDLPVLLVVNVHGMSRSLAALVHGFSSFEPGVRVAGVIANQCGSDRHASLLEEALASSRQPPLVGAFPRGAFPALQSRHLGLVASRFDATLTDTMKAFRDAAEMHCRFDELFERRIMPAPSSWTDALRRKRKPDISELAGARAHPVQGTKVRLGVPSDSAFCFYYKDNLNMLEERGCEIVPFSPVHDDALPMQLDGLYLGGGYPEEFASQLSAQERMRQDIRAFAASGKPIYAECGGLMYLSQGIELGNGERYPMAGVLPFWTRMLARRKMLGYVEVATRHDGLLGRSGSVLRGHEFHYSEIVDMPESHPWRSVYEARYRRNNECIGEGFCKGNVQASYVHVHFASCPSAVDSFVNFMRDSR